MIFELGGCALCIKVANRQSHCIYMWYSICGRYVNYVKIIEIIAYGHSLQIAWRVHVRVMSAIKAGYLVLT